MNESQNPFVLKIEEYQRDVEVLKHYVLQVATFLSKKNNIPVESAINFVRDNLKKGGHFEFKDVDIVYYERQENGDKIEKKGKLFNYIKTSLKNQELIAPTFTTYISDTKKESPLAKFTINNVNKRNKSKHEMFVAESKKDYVLYDFKKIEQTSFKTQNNSLSGGFGSAFTPLYNKSAHSTLTSTTRSTSSYGNANNEKFISGNRHYFNYEIVINNIISIISNTDYNKFKQVIEKYNIYIPTTEDVMNCIKYSSTLYWDEECYLDKIKDLVKTLNNLEKCAFVYTGDLYHLKKFNENLVKNFILELSKKCFGSIDNPIDVIKNSEEDHVNLAQQICSNITKGIGKDYSKIKDINDLNTIALTCLNIKNTVLKYGDLIDCFYVTKNIPSSVANFPSSIRRAAITSDTDSTIYTVQDWVYWLTNDYSFNDVTAPISATINYLANATIVHILALMSVNFGISKKNLFRISMKNEYTFPVFIPTNNTKHYFASKSCQEGNVFEKIKLEIKGVHLKNSNAPRKINEQIESIIKELLLEVETKVSIEGMYYLKKVANIEKEIIDNVLSGKVDYYRVGKINNSDSYAKDEEQSPFARHTFWNNVFGKKYGIMPNPPYSTYKINITTETRRLFKLWVDSIEDEHIKNKLNEWFLINNKELKTIYVPVEILTNTGIPKEILSVVNYRKIVKDCCISFYIILETLGLFIVGENDKLVSDIY